MKIAMVFDGLGFGGAERVGIDYVKILLSMGHQVDIYNIFPKQNGMVCELLSGAKYRPITYKKRYCPAPKPSNQRMPFLSRYLKSIALFFQRSFYLLHRPRKRYDVSIAFTGKINDLRCVGNGFISASKKICWCHGGGVVFFALRSAENIFLLSKIKNVIVLSDFMQEATLLAYPQLRDLNIKKIYNPTFVNTKTVDIVNVNELKAKYGSFVLNIMRFDWEKDHITILQAIEILKDSGINIKCLFVGDGPRKAIVEAFATSIGVDDLCVFCGAKYNVADYYAAAEVYVHSSPAEGLPTTFLEAMKYQLPIVATNSMPGVYEILQDGKCGIVVSVGDAPALANGIKKMLTEPETRKRYIDLGNERIKDFSPDIIQKQFAEYLATLV